MNTPSVNFVVEQKYFPLFVRQSDQAFIKLTLDFDVLLAIIIQDGQVFWIVVPRAVSFGRAHL